MRRSLPACLMAAVGLLLSAPTAHAGGGFAYDPQPPDYLIEVPNGISFSVALPELPIDIDAVRFEVGGIVAQTNEFEPFLEPINTRRLVRRGVSLDDVHAFKVLAIPIFGTPTLIGDYKLQIHELPVIRRVHVYPIVFRKRQRLAGFQLRGIARGSRVKAWAQGLRLTRGNYPLPLKLVKRRRSSRTYRVPGGYEWLRERRPRLIFSIVPPLGKSRYGIPFRGRIYIGRLKTDRSGDTVIRHLDDWDLCTDFLTRRGNRPPRKQSCVFY